MSFLNFQALSPGGQIVNLAVHLLAGLLLGLFYFRSLWRSVCELTGGASATTIMLRWLVRFALSVAFLGLASMEGGIALLVTTLGVVLARLLTVRHVRLLAR